MVSPTGNKGVHMVGPAREIGVLIVSTRTRGPTGEMGVLIMSAGSRSFRIMRTCKRDERTVCLVVELHGPIFAHAVIADSRNVGSKPMRHHVESFCESAPFGLRHCRLPLTE